MILSTTSLPRFSFNRELAERDLADPTLRKSSYYALDDVIDAIECAVDPESPYDFRLDDDMAQTAGILNAAWEAGWIAGPGRPLVVHDRWSFAYEARLVGGPKIMTEWEDWKHFTTRDESGFATGAPAVLGFLDYMVIQLNLAMSAWEAYLSQRTAREGEVARFEPTGPTHIRLLQEDMADWQQRNFGDGDELSASVGLAEEVGEVCRAVVKRHQGIRGTREEWDAEIRKEVGDVFIKLVDVARTYRFDLADAIAERWGTIQRRNWKADPQGHGIDPGRGAR